MPSAPADELSLRSRLRSRDGLASAHPDIAEIGDDPGIELAQMRDAVVALALAM